MPLPPPRVPPNQLVNRTCNGLALWPHETDLLAYLAHVGDFSEQRR